MLSVAIALPLRVQALDDCPAKSPSYDDRIAAISGAESCGAAMELLSACMFGASGDRGLSNRVIEICEADFLPALRPRRKAAYLAEKKGCARKHAAVEGTMRISAIATCEAMVAAKYSKASRAGQ
jgi:hypothetical protein